MTVIAAYSDDNTHWIASDSMGTDNGVMVELGGKLIRKNEYLIGFTWSYRVADVVREGKNYPEDIRSIIDMRKFRDALMEDLKEQAGVKDTADPGRVMEAPVGLVLVSSSGIYQLESDFQIHKIRNGYSAIGSGYEFAYGALYCAKTYGLSGKEAVTNAVNAAIFHCPSCGGKCHVKSVRRD